MSRAAKPTAADLLEREREFHDRLAGQIDPHDETPHDPDPLEKGLLERLGDVRGLRVLDLGCGSGELSATLLARGAAVTGIDLSPGMVAVARKRAEARGLAEHAIFVAAPAHELPFDDSAFDIVVGKWILHHLDGEAETTEIRRVLKPGGRALFAENSGANPVLRIARERLAGRFGIPRFGTEDEHPLEDADLETYRRCFAHVEVMYPSFHFWQLLDRQALRYRWSRPSRALRALDDATWRYVPAARRFSFHMLIEIS
jgi:ubiquinone/menaquinone biosynthesis C-methylase UbiE